MMKCSDVRIWVGALADGEVRDRTRRRALEEHVESCPSCRQELATQQEMKQLVASVEREQASPFLATKVAANVRARPRRALGRLQLAYVAAAFVVVLAITSGLIFGLQQAARQGSANGLLKELPPSSSIAAGEYGRGPFATGTSENFYEFVEAEHERATELVRARTEWADDLESLLEEIGQDETVDEETHLKELPSEETAEERDDREK